MPAVRPPPLDRRPPRPGGPRWLPLLLGVAVVVGFASSVEAQVGATGRRVWTATCVSPGATELVAYGAGWAPGAVDLKVTGLEGAEVGSGSATAVDRSGTGVFQVRLPLSGPGPGSLKLTAVQGAGSAEQVMLAAPSCPGVPSLTATVPDPAEVPCVPAGRPVDVAVEVRGTNGFPFVVHHADLHGPAEVVERTQPSRPTGDYTFPLRVPNVPGRLVPVTLEAQRVDRSYAYATTNVTLPPACAAPTTTAPPPGGPAPGPAATAPGTTQPPAATVTTAPAAPPATVPASSLPGFPRPAPSGSTGLALSSSVGRAGEVVTVSGRGFAPSQALILYWRPGTGAWPVTTGGDGSFRTQVLVLPNDVEGPRVLDVLGGGATPLPYLVVPGSAQPTFGGVFVRG